MQHFIVYDEFPTADMTHDVLAHYFWWGPWTLPHPSRLVGCTKDVKFLLLLELCHCRIMSLSERVVLKGLS